MPPLFRHHCRFCLALSCLATDAGAPPSPTRRRLLGALGAAPLAALAQAQQPPNEGVRGEVGKNSVFTNFVSAEQVERAAAPQYSQLLQQASQKGALAPENHPQLLRLRAISRQIIPHTAQWNPRAAGWRWEVNLIGSQQVNAFCMPGGKIAFFSGILQQLQLDDDEVATIMGHEMAHALREHARERIGKSTATGLGLSLGAQLLGLGSAGDLAANIGTQL
jgi:Zn-dependent protease with chaperone function